MKNSRIVSTKYRLVVNASSDGWLLLKRMLQVVAVVAVIIWSFYSIGFSLKELIQGLDGIVDIAGRMFPPKVSKWRGIVKPIVETINISVSGTFIAVLLSIPLGILAAKNISPNGFFYNLSRLLLNTIRTIPDMVFALIFVAAVGLGPLPGVLAIGVSSSGMLGKFLADSIEGTNQGKIDAIRATGANYLQVLVYGVIPQITAEFISLVLFRWEMNFRSSTVLGIVGAGGIGFDLITSIRLFQYKETTTILLGILLVVILVDFISNSIRNSLNADD